MASRRTTVSLCGSRISRCFPPWSRRAVMRRWSKVAKHGVSAKIYFSHAKYPPPLTSLSRILLLGWHPTLSLSLSLSTPSRARAAPRHQNKSLYGTQTRAPRTFIQTSIPEPYCETTHGLSTGSGPPGVRVLRRHDVLNVRPDPDDHLLILLELAHYGAAGEAPVLLLLEHLPLLRGLGH